MNPHTATLRMVANLIDTDMPMPFAIDLWGEKPIVQVCVDDIGHWLTAMEIVEPTWYGAPGDYMHARWPEGTFDAHPFVLVCLPTAMAAVEVKR